jgi:hypothetical protein
MRVDVVESLPPLSSLGLAVREDAGAERALRSFSAALESDDSLFACEISGAGISGTSFCGDFLLRFRSPSLEASRRIHFALIEKLTELLKSAGSADSLAMQICLVSDSAANSPTSGFSLQLRLDARGATPEQASLRWGLGVAHLQQALLFVSRFLRQQISQNAD